MGTLKTYYDKPKESRYVEKLNKIMSIAWGQGINSISLGNNIHIKARVSEYIFTKCCRRCQRFGTKGSADDSGTMEAHICW